MLNLCTTMEERMWFLVLIVLAHGASGQSSAATGTTTPVAGFNSHDDCIKAGKTIDKSGVPAEATVGWLCVAGRNGVASPSAPPSLPGRNRMTSPSAPERPH
jgi:hypothetical protein